jgi:ABC-type transporter Mla subunit MlaD
VDILTVVLVVLALAAVWLVVELVLTVRRARGAVDALRQAVDEARPVVANVNDLVEQARPSVARVDPVLDQTTRAVAALADDLRKVDAILGDVSNVSKVAGNATVAVGDAADTLAAKARTLFKARRGAARANLAPGAPQANEPAAYDAAPAGAASYGEAPVYEEAGYFTYPAAPEPPAK